MPHAKFPHLIPEDCALWQRFLDLRGDLYIAFEYDIRVGEGRNPGPDFEPATQQMAIDLSKRRIDAIGYTNDKITLFEITQLADLKCLGQLLAYPLLFDETFKPDLPIKCALVAAEIGTDLENTLAKLNPEIYLLPKKSTASGGHQATTEPQNEPKS